ncbi:MAG TPA: DNA alkylation repair protein, partial [Planctomycetota bacterium]|nr:DNA alkylation repair protein [Planctomycetota bacterium]
AMNAAEVMKELQERGDPQTKKTWLRHGVPEPLFGVKIGEMKLLMKKTGKDTSLARELYKTGNADAMYFAGLIGDGAELSRAELQEWAERATCSMVADYTVPWMASEHPEGWSIGLAWIDSPSEKIACAGWHTLSSIVSTREDQDLDLGAVQKLLDRVVKTIGSAPNMTRYTMNSYVIAVGGAVKPLTKKALAAAAKIGKVEVDMGDTDCKVPSATDYIKKVIASGRHGKKRAHVKC